MDISFEYYLVLQHDFFSCIHYRWYQNSYGYILHLSSELVSKHLIVTLMMLIFLRGSLCTFKNFFFIIIALNTQKLILYKSIDKL